MFVSIVLDPGGVESAKQLSSLLPQYGFKKIQRSCWESTVITEASVNNLKREIDKITDFYDTIRMYQYPIQGTFAITELSKKKWRKLVVKPPKSML